MFTISLSYTNTKSRSIDLLLEDLRQLSCCLRKTTEYCVTHEQGCMLNNYKPLLERVVIGDNIDFYQKRKTSKM